jgi:RNA polymerase-interacting CarD/CdnL/TRCF family regulator
MDFHEGDPVMHWTYGFGKVIRLEERDLSGANVLYYAVQIKDMTVWVPADGKLGTRLRPPTPEAGFKKLVSILSSPGNPLPEDRMERKAHLSEMLKDGRAESLCQIIRDLSASQKIKSLNDSDQMLLKQAQNAILGEWGFALSITPAQAELELHRLLTPESIVIDS